MQHRPARLLRLVDDGFEAGGGLRMAVATHDLRQVSEPFGRTVLLAVYDVFVGSSELVAVIEFAPVPQRCTAANDNPEDCESRISARLDALPGCHVLVAREIGDVAAAAAMKRRIHPIELTRAEPIAALIARCQRMLASNPPPWLRRLMTASGGGLEHLDPEHEDPEAGAELCGSSSPPKATPLAAAL